MIGFCTVCREHYDSLDAYVWHTEHCAGPVICRRHQASLCTCRPYQPRKAPS